MTLDADGYEQAAAAMQWQRLRTPMQRKIKADKSHRRALLAGRRGGKTQEWLYEFTEDMEAAPNTVCVFIELTRPAAKRKFWHPWKQANIENGWGLKFAETDLEAIHPNGARTIMLGADKTSEIDKIRGITKLRKAVIDECGHQKPALLKYLVEEVIEPALMDLNGDLGLSGTPGIVPSGYWYDVTTGKAPGWSIHKFTSYDNPHVNAADFIEKMLHDRGLTMESYLIQREYLARWTFDSSRRVYPFEPERNLVDFAPFDKGWTVVLSMDFGNVHATSWVIWAYPPIGRDAYVLYSTKKYGMTPSDVADETQRIVKQWNPVRIRGDLGGLGKAYSVEMRKRHGIVIQPAEKADRRAGIEMLIDGLKAGTVKLVRSTTEGLQHEFLHLVWDELHENLEGGQDDDESDGALYGYRDVLSYLNAEPVDDPEADLPAKCRADYEYQPAPSRDEFDNF